MSLIRENADRLRESWSVGQPTFGGWCSIPDSFAAEVMGHVGFDWVCIDLQHGLASSGAMVSMMQALTTTRTPTFIRVPWNEPAMIMRSLDLGAVGVIVPMVNDAAAAAEAVAACRYAPEGTRSYGPTRAGLLDGAAPTGEINRLIICAVMVETQAGLDALDEILAVPGVDVVFVGPADLKVSTGAPSMDDPGYLQNLAHIATACRRHSVVAGIFCPTAEQAVAWRELGYLMMAVSSDARFLRDAATSALAAAR